jgi:hypothetical protein
LKTDGTYFVSKKLGGDHALKFGVGWRKNPVLTFTLCLSLWLGLGQKCDGL